VPGYNPGKVVITASISATDPGGIVLDGPYSYHRLHG
jgi:hypothetical protein